MACYEKDLSAILKMLFYAMFYREVISKSYLTIEMFFFFCINPFLIPFIPFSD